MSVKVNSKKIPRNHVIISGAGRAGTTFLVELLTRLGLDTEFTTQNLRSHINMNARAGLEFDIRRDDAPYIIKGLWFCDYADEIVKRDDIFIDHVFIPIRDLDAAVESRRFVSKRSVSKLPFLERQKSKIKSKSRRRVMDCQI